MSLDEWLDEQVEIEDDGIIDTTAEDGAIFASEGGGDYWE